MAAWTKNGPTEIIA